MWILSFSPKFSYRSCLMRLRSLRLVHYLSRHKFWLAESFKKSFHLNKKLSMLFCSWNWFCCRKLVYFDFDILNRVSTYQGFVGVQIEPWCELATTSSGDGEFWLQYGWWWWQDPTAAAVFKGDVKNEDKDPVAQTEHCRKPILQWLHWWAYTCIKCEIKCIMQQLHFT